MGSTHLVTLFAALICLVNAQCASPAECKEPHGHKEPHLDKCSDESVFDLYLLSREWDPGFCAGGKKCDISRERAAFTLHGLWPECRSPTPLPGYPHDCHKAVFSMSELDSIKEDLALYWPSLLQNSTCFYQHEYLKHGTCASGALRSELEYFRKALDLHKRYDFQAALKAASQRRAASPEWEAREVLAAFDKATGVPDSTALDCARTADGDSVLSEVRTCFDTDFLPMRCPARLLSKGSCKVFLIPTRLSSAAGASTGSVEAQ